SVRRRATARFMSSPMTGRCTRSGFRWSVRGWPCRCCVQECYVLRARCLRCSVPGAGSSHRGHDMRRVILASAAVAGVWGLGIGVRAQAPGSKTGQLIDWITDGGDNQRTGWNKDEQILTKENVKSLKLLWKLQTDNEPRALHALMPVLVVAQLKTANGTKQIGFVSGISDNLYAFEVETSKVLWQRHWTYEPPAPPAGF